MEVIVIIAAIFLAVELLKLAAVCLRKIMERAHRFEIVEEETDPCMECLRWPECNGVDRDSCQIAKRR